MSTSEKSIVETEELIPQIARTSTGKAYRKAKTLNDSIIMLKDGSIKKIFTEGDSVVLKKISPRRRIEIGTVIPIK